MDWKGFLEDFSDRMRFTPEQRSAFVARFSEENLESSIARVANQIGISEAALKKHLSAIYDRVGQEFPQVAAIKGRGKREELWACLKEAYKQRSNPPETAEVSQVEGSERRDRKAGTRKSQTALKPGAPFPGVRLPENFVPRPDALEVVKAKLLVETDQTLVVSAICGLGGLGKSVLATALVLDLEVQARFSDGILWVTLGQSPDLQNLLGDWIRMLDRSRESFSATTLEGAKSYLHNLLLDRRMLLVVDDVWHEDHAECFRVGGAGCRVLVTTREARLEGADYHELDLMTEAEAVELVRGKLGQRWKPDHDGEVRAFAKVVGYLPLALDLSASLVRDGLSWGELRAEFEVERRAVELEILDSGESFERLSEQERERAERKHSLRACFNLSLRRLGSEQLRQFAWLGVLPEDVSLDTRGAMTLWSLPDPVKAQRALIMLYRRSLLTSAGETLEGKPCYRVHDLMHDAARGVIESAADGSGKGGLAGLGMSLAEAHGQFLERYRQRSGDGSWFGLPQDGYIHRHLTWHLEQAGWDGEIHRLLAERDRQGRNAWFEVCDRLGQPAIFVQDVARAWTIAERHYATEPIQAIVLQCRYALITATQNSLVENLPVGMMAEFVKRDFWTVEQAWAYVEQMQDPEKIAHAISALAAYLSPSLFQIAVGKTRSIRSEYDRARALIDLAKIDSAYFLEALEAARSIQDESSRAEILIGLAKLDSAYFLEVLEAARSIQDKYYRSRVLRDLAKLDSAYFSEALEAARSLQDDYSRARVLSDLAELDLAYFSEALEAARSIQYETSRAEVLRDLAKIDSAYFLEALEAACFIQDQYEFSREEVLSDLSNLDSAYFPEVLEAARSLQDESSRARVLSDLAELDLAYFPEALEAARSIQDESSRAWVLKNLAKLDSAYFSEALEAARSLQDDYSRACVLRDLSNLDSAYFPEALEAARSTQGEASRAEVLRDLSNLDSAYFPEALETARSLQDDYSRARVLSDLSNLDSAYFPEALEAARSLQDDYSRARVLRDLSNLDSAYFPEALEAARSIQDEDNRAWVLIGLAELDSAYFSEALEAARSIQCESRRAWNLIGLAKRDSAYFSEALEATRSIQDESSRARVLIGLAELDSAYFPEALEAARSLQNESRRAELLRNLAKRDSAYFPEALEAVWSIQDESGWAKLLIDLAKIDSAYFPEALEAARSIQDEDSRARVLIDLTKRDSAYFPEALEAARSIQNEYSRVKLLRNLATLNSADFLPHLYQAIIEITDRPRGAEALSGYLPHISLTQLPYLEWCDYLHRLAHRKREYLMDDLATLYPAIRHLGGDAAVRGMIDAMREVCQQWK